jgi:L-alanine-DL-glutamate epimerase-like enolase superfamily enzyme
MKIVDLALRVAKRRYDSGLRNSRHPWKEKNALLVFVTTEEGVVGVGEGWCENGAPETFAPLILRDLRPLVVGQSVWAVEQIGARLLETNAMSAKGGILWSAASAIDIAVWDAWARTLKQPLYRLLGGSGNSLPAYGSSGMYGENYGPDALARDMADAMARGFNGVKIKTGGAMLAEDVARAVSVRQAIGPAARLMVDALWSQDVPGAIRLGKALASSNLHFYEAPTAREDLRGWAQIQAAVGIPLAGPEIASGLHVFRDFLEAGIVQYLQADAIVCGGITELRKIAAMAQAFARPLSLHCSGSAVALAANAHLGAAIPNCDGVEVHLFHQTFFDRLWSAGFAVKGGRLHLPDAPGLGIDLRPDDPALTNVAQVGP